MRTRQTQARRQTGGARGFDLLEGRALLTTLGLVQFGPPAPVAFNGNPNATALADFDRDGKLDLAAALGGRDLGVAPGNGDGTFQAARYFTGDPSPFFATTLSIAVGDFNNDGKPDLATSTFSTNQVSVLLNESTGAGNLAFGDPITHGAGAEPVYVVVGDFNRDGRLDVATANIAADPGASVGVLLGNGDGTFQDVRFLAAGANADSLAVGDFNRDGVPDLAVTYGADAGPSANQVGVLLGNGDGTFQDVRYFSGGTAPTALAIGDFNRDGIVDIAAANEVSNNVSILLGDGSGNFTNRYTLPVGKAPNGIAAADFNGDGRTDLAVANSGDQTLTVLYGKGNGDFYRCRPANRAFAVGGESTGKISVGRLARSGRPDVVVPTTNHVAVLVNGAHARQARPVRLRHR